MNLSDDSEKNFMQPGNVLDTTRQILSSGLKRVELVVLEEIEQNPWAVPIVELNFVFSLVFTLSATLALYVLSFEKADSGEAHSVRILNLSIWLCTSVLVASAIRLLDPSGSSLMWCVSLLWVSAISLPLNQAFAAVEDVSLSASASNMFCGIWVAMFVRYGVLLLFWGLNTVSPVALWSWAAICCVFDIHREVKRYLACGSCTVRSAASAYASMRAYAVDTWTGTYKYMKKDSLSNGSSGCSEGSTSDSKALWLSSVTTVELCDAVFSIRYGVYVLLPALCASDFSLFRSYAACSCAAALSRALYLIARQPKRKLSIAIDAGQISNEKMSLLGATPLASESMWSG